MRHGGAAQRAGSILLLLVSAGPVPFALAQHDGIPDTIVAERAEVETPAELAAEGIELTPLSDYLWVSAEAVDRLGLGVLFRPTAMLVEQSLARSEELGGCGGNDMVQFSCGNPMAIPADFAGLVDRSRSIVEGSVIGHRGGFFSVDMGFLVALEIEAVLSHADAATTPEGRILVFYPGPGSFTLLGKDLCLPDRLQDALPPVPVAGDRVILFSAHHTIDPDASPISVAHGNLVIERAGGSLELPMKLRGDPFLRTVTTFDEIRREIARRRPN